MKTIKDVAEEYRVSAQSVYRWIKDKKLQAIRLPGGTYRISEEDFEKIKRLRAKRRSLSIEGNFTSMGGLSELSMKMRENVG